MLEGKIEGNPVLWTWKIQGTQQHAKKVVSDSPGLMDFAIGLVNSVLNLPDGQVKQILRNSTYRRTVKSFLLFKKFWGLVEMTFGLFVSFSLPKQQAVKMTFFAPCPAYDFYGKSYISWSHKPKSKVPEKTGIY